RVCRKADDRWREQRWHHGEGLGQRRRAGARQSGGVGGGFGNCAIDGGAGSRGCFGGTDQREWAGPIAGAWVVRELRSVRTETGRSEYQGEQWRRFDQRCARQYPVPDGERGRDVAEARRAGGGTNTERRRQRRTRGAAVGRQQV